MSEQEQDNIPERPDNSMSEYQPDIREFRIPHHKSRPAPVDGIIVHSMGQYIAGTFAGQFLNVSGLSAHALVDHLGVIYECVDYDRQAYHAGLSKLGDQENLNRTFIGIELLIEGDHTYATFLEAIKDPESFTNEHYNSLSWLCNKLVKKYHIDLQRIRRHSEVSGSDVRPDPKQDPGQGFDMNRLLDLM